MTELGEIYARYFKDVYLFVYSLSKNQHVAEDVTSETFLKVMRSLDSFKGESDLKVWLFQIANIRITHIFGKINVWCRQKHFTKKKWRPILRKRLWTRMHPSGCIRFYITCPNPIKRCSCSGCLES